MPNHAEFPYYLEGSGLPRPGGLSPRRILGSSFLQVGNQVSPILRLFQPRKHHFGPCISNYRFHESKAAAVDPDVFKTNRSLIYLRICTTLFRKNETLLSLLVCSDCAPT
jgi:hypothetical protein